MISSKPASNAATPVEDGLVPVVPGGEQAVVGVEGDGLAALDLAPADRRVADRLGHHQRLDRAGRLRHRAGIGRGVEARVQRQQRGEALGGVACRDDGHRPLGHRCDLASGQDDVRVVGQDDDLAGIDGADRLEQLAGARVGGLAALDDRRDPEVAEDRRQAVTRDDRDDAQRRRRDGNGARVGIGRGRSGRRRLAGEGRGARLADVAGLVVEVLDADPAQRADAQPVPDDEVRSLVVDMDLERAAVAGHEHRLADRFEVVADGVDVETARAVGLEQVHRLVAEPLVRVGDQGRWLDPGPGVRALAGGARRRLADEMEERPLEQAVEPLPARIDDAGLAQDRQQARRPGDRLLGGGERGGQDGLDVVVALGGLDRGVGRLADDRQDRAFDGLGDRAVRGLGPERQGVGQVEAVEPALAAQTLGHPAEDLAGDDARVAARAHQRPEADRGGDPFGRAVGGRLGLVERGLDRGVHVRARVAVGDRIDVERVDLVDVRLEVGDGRLERSEEALAVARAARHQATSVPLSARSRCPTAAGSTRSTDGGPPPGPKRRPSMWMVRRRTSRSSALRSA